MKAKLEARCPIRTSLEMLGGKWRLLILHQVSEGNHRFGELKRNIPEISEKMLTQELKFLTQSDLLIRKNYGEVPPRVEYSLNELGEEAVKLIDPIASFGEGYLSSLQGRS